MRQKIFNGKSWYSPLSYSNYLGTRNFCNSKGFHYGKFRHCETKNFWRKILVLLPSLIQTFSIPEIIATIKDYPTEIFSTVRQKIFDGKSWWSPPPAPLIQTLSVNEISETLKASPTKFFGTVRRKIFLGKSWYSPLSYPNFFDTRNYCNNKGLPYGNFRHCEIKNFRRKVLMVPPRTSYPNFFDTRNFCNNKGFPYGNFRHCETKNIWRKILVLLPSLIQTFSIPEIIATIKDYLTEIFGTVR